MNVYGSGTASIRIRVLTSTCLLVTLGACSSGADKELTSMRPYADLIGDEYRVIAEDLHAYGVYGNWPDETLTSVKLIPGVGIDGQEIAFSRHIPKGQIIKILSAWDHFMLFDNGVYYRVAVQNSDLPTGVPVAIELFRGNEGPGVDLNPNVYEKIPRDN